MKKMYICAAIVCASLTLNAQLGGTKLFKTTACAENLLESYRRLTARTGLQSCWPHIYTVPGYMQAGCYAGQKDSGHVTFASFFDEQAGGAFFRTTWDSAALGYNYYGACMPAHIVWDIPWNGGTRNHVYEAVLVEASKYQGSKNKSYDYIRNTYALKSDEITKLISWEYETTAGWIATHEAANYNNVNSSKGLSFKVKLKSGKTVTCYLLNNYDGAGTLTWKSDISTGADPLAEREKTTTVNVKLVSATLGQCQPNPANNNTSISYTLPEKFTSAKIKITDYTGNVLKEINLNGLGNSKINADVHSLNAGTYKYSLVIDGVMMDTKTMIVVK